MLDPAKVHKNKVVLILNPAKGHKTSYLWRNINSVVLILEKVHKTN